MGLPNERIKHLWNLAVRCLLRIISQNVSGNMQCYTLLTYETAHTQNISRIRLHMKDGLIKNQMSHICKNSELLSGSFCKDRKSNEKCYRNQYAEFMLAMMMALEL